MSPSPTIIASPGERMIYLVQSDRQPGKSYRVDLTANGGLSECSCVDWQTRRGPLVHKQPPPPVGTRECRCKHVSRAREHFLNHLLADMARAETRP